MLKKFVIILFFALPSLRAQDMHFTQFYATPMNLNPAFTGANACSRFSMVYRNQWPGVATAYKSYLASFDHFSNKHNIGIGLAFGVDESGTGALRTTVINPAFAYEFKFNHHSMIRFGLQPGFGIKSINFNKLLFGDQIYRGGNVTTVENPTQTRKFMDIGTGALFTYENYWLGSSFFHLNKPIESLYGDQSVITPIKYSIHGGAKYLINKDESYDVNKKYVSFALHYRGQNEFDQLDLGIYFTKNILNVGLWYRGIPVLKAYKTGYQNNDAVSIIIGMSVERLNIGYSYDITISKLSANSRGAHELTMSYQICKPKKASKIKNRKAVYCPKF